MQLSPADCLLPVHAAPGSKPLYDEMVELRESLQTSPIVTHLLPYLFNMTDQAERWVEQTCRSIAGPATTRSLKELLDDLMNSVSRAQLQMEAQLRKLQVGMHECTPLLVLVFAVRCAKSRCSDQQQCRTYTAQATGTVKQRVSDLLWHA